MVDDNEYYNNPNLALSQILQRLEFIYGNLWILFLPLQQANPFYYL